MIPDIILALLAETAAGAATSATVLQPSLTGASTPTVAYPEIAHVLSALAKLVVLSLCLERAFAFIFEWEWSRRLLEKPATDGQLLETESRFPGLKAVITLATSWMIGRHFQFDVLQVLFGAEQPDALGIGVTSLMVAGGSAGAIKLFQGALGFHKPTRDAQVATKRIQAETAAVAAQADFAKALTEKRHAESLIPPPLLRKNDD